MVAGNRAVKVDLVNRGIVDVNTAVVGALKIMTLLQCFLHISQDSSTSTKGSFWLP